MGDRRQQDAGGHFRRFNGVKYHLFSTHATKTRAKEQAKSLRKGKGKARIIKNGSRWEVYSR